VESVCARFGLNHFSGSGVIEFTRILWPLLPDLDLWDSDRPPGTVCRLHYEHQSCHRTPSHVHWRRTCSRPPGTVETFQRDSGAEYKCTDLLTYLPSSPRHHVMWTCW